MICPGFTRYYTMSPPEHPRLDYGHWAARDLELAIACNTYRPVIVRGMNARDAGDKPIAVADWNALITATACDWGNGVRFNAATHQVQIASVTGTTGLFVLPTTSITILLIMKKADTTLREGGAFAYNDAGVAGEVCAIRCPDSTGVIDWKFGGTSGNNLLQTAALTWSTNPETYAFVAGLRGMAIYRNGVIVASSTTAVSRTNSGSTKVVELNEADNGTTGDIRQYMLVAIYNTEWLPSMVHQWHVNPWQMFRPF